MIKWLFRLIAFPLVIIFRVLGCFMVYIVHYLGLLCRLLSGMIFILVVLGFVTGLGTYEGLLKMSSVSFAFFLLIKLLGL